MRCFWPHNKSGKDKGYVHSGSGEPYFEPKITVHGTRLKVVDTFPYLGSTLSRDGSLDTEIYIRIQKASVAFGKLEERVWSDRGIIIKTKVVVYMTCVLTALLYSSETWTAHQQYLKWLERFQQMCLRRILHIKWQSLTPDTEVFQTANCQMHWSRRVVRMGDDLLPKQLFYGEFEIGRRPQHMPKKRYKDCIKNNLKSPRIAVGNWKEPAANCSKWRHSIEKGCDSFEKEKLKHVRVKRGLREGTNPNLPDSTTTWQYNVCGRGLLLQAGYANHLKSKNNLQKQSDCTDLLPSPPPESTCVICGKVCKSVSGLKRHIYTHKDVIP